MDKMDHAGIEVSARELLLALRRDGELGPLKSFPNTPQGHRALGLYLTRQAHRVRVCLESTGIYGLDLALALAQRSQIQVMVANPRAVRHFAQALMQRNKNDRLDAEVLVEFAARMPFKPWQPPSRATLELCALARRLEAITELCTAEKNRLHAAQAAQALPQIIRQDLRRSIRFHQRALQRLTRQARRVIARDSQLERQFNLLDTIPGIGETSAVHLLAELATLAPDLDVRQWVAYAGLDPREYTSGSSVHKKTRISKAGNRHLRRALYMPALVALRREPHLRAFYLHLLARGKAKMQALVAVARKLLHAIYGMFKHQQPYNGSKVYRLKETVTLAPLTSCTMEAA
jgi:transposase